MSGRIEGPLNAGVRSAGHAPWTVGALTVWGKTCRESGDWMPVVQHLADAAGVAGLLWEEWLPQSLKDSIERALPEDARDGRALVTWLAGQHDVGKCSPAFAVAVPPLADAMNRVGLHCPTMLADTHRVRHELVGQIALKDWLVDTFATSRTNAASYADVVGIHHGRAMTDSQVQDARRRPPLLGDGLWHQTRVEIMEGMTARVGATDLVRRWVTRPLPPTTRILVSAVVVLADWLASDSERFPLVTTPTDDPERLAAAWADLDLPDPWSPQADPRDVDELLVERFPTMAGRTARPVQRTCVEMARQTGSAALMVVQAPMGVGKTEAALLAAEQLAARDGSGGVFVALPTMATSDAMFARVRSWVDNLPARGRSSMFLAHGKASLNDEYAGMARDARTFDIYGDGPADGAVAASWLSGRRKGVLADFVVGTVDQVLYLALHQKFLALRHLALAGKVVVIDEVHAADAVMQAFLLRTLEWLAAYGTSVVLLSATLPSSQHRALVEAYQRGLDAEGQVEATAYPSVTVVDESGSRTVEVQSTADPVAVDVRLLSDDMDDLREELRALLADGGRAAVIRDTVGRAQETYAVLREEYGEDVVLTHSRFLAVDRARRDGLLRDQLGPDSSGRPERLVVVGTQVLEQSLDVDFDVMVSDVAPVDLLLQRLGRLHRHQRGPDERPAALRSPMLLLTGITDWTPEGMPTFDRGVTAVYDQSLLLRTVAALGIAPGRPALVSVPTDLQPLVERVYADSADVPRAWAATVADADAKRAKDIDEVQRQKTLGRRLDEVPEPNRDDSTALSKVLLPGSDDPDCSGGSVRDGEDGLEVIAVQQGADGQLHVMPGEFRGAGEVIPHLLGSPDDRVARAMASCTVRLPRLMTHPGVVEQVLDALESQGYDGFQASRWLKGQLVLTFDPEFRATVASFNLRYDDETGLTVTRSEDA